MIIDLHIHERTHSADSALGIFDIIENAKRLGLDAICITDHESDGLKSEARVLTERTGMPVLVGAEVLSDAGDILCYGLPEVPAAGIGLERLLAMVEAAGGAAIAAHPYRINNRGLKDRLLSARGLHAVEAFNGSTCYENNLRALRAAKACGLPVTGASDAHVPDRLGVFATRIPDGIRSLRDLIEVIRTGQTEPVVYLDGAYRPIGEYLEAEREEAV